MTTTTPRPTPRLPRHGGRRRGDDGGVRGHDGRHQRSDHGGRDGRDGSDHRRHREGPETTAGEEVDPASIETDIGVDDTTIKVGMLADLSGAFAPLVTEIVEAQEVYWDKVNEEGGIAGRQIELVVEDNAYDVATQLEKYEVLRDEVAILSQSTGSPHTSAIAQSLVDDDLVAIPLSWYSGWPDPGVRPERVRELHDVLHRVDERHRVAGHQPRRADGRAHLVPRRVRRRRRCRRAHGRRGARAGDRLRRRRPGHPAVGGQPQPRPERGDRARSWRRAPTSSGRRSTRRR